jgi:hypothetical protein
MQVRNAIIAIEAATGVGICFHDFDGSVAAVVGDARIRHHHRCAPGSRRRPEGAAPTAICAAARRISPGSRRDSGSCAMPV